MSNDKSAIEEPPLTDAQLRARTENLLSEAVQVANQLRIQTERLAQAINTFHSDTHVVLPDMDESDHASG